MTLEESYKKYKISPEILKDYKDSPKFIDFNLEDPDLDTIRVELPKTPDWNTIDGFGLKAKDQFFKRVEMPDKLRVLQDETDEFGLYRTQDEIWEILESEQDDYVDEIEFIKTQWRRRLYGYWFFNNGVATYINGWNYFYLNFWSLDKGLPEYRDRDRRFFLFATFCESDDSSFGFVYPKHRREGATSKAACINYAITSLSERDVSGIQSKTDDDAFEVFQKHIIYPWRSVPFFFKPNHEGGDDPKNKLSFKTSGSRGKAGQKKISRKSLLSEITYNTSNEQAYDGFRLIYYHHDELGKVKNIDIEKRWDVVKLCLSEGAGGVIHGFSIHTSTVGEMEKGGGTAMRKLCDDSKYSERDENGQTASGLYVLFIPASDGLKGYIDKYGMSVIDTPTKDQKEYLSTKRNKKGKIICPNPNIGAKEFIRNTVEFHKKRKDRIRLNQFLRDHPDKFRECFRTNSKDSFFDVPSIEDRLDELAYIKDAVTRGNFEWTGKKYLSPVRFVVDPEGRFEISKHPDRPNSVTWDSINLTWVCSTNMPIYCAGADPFKNDKTASKKRSMFGGGVYWGHDIRIDPYEKPMEDWKSARFVCTYNNRPDTKEEGCEDMMMMCSYYGCPMNPEVDVPTVREEFEKHHFSGMLLHKYENDKFALLAGVTAAKHKQVIFLLYKTQIKRHVMRECHKELLEQCRDIRGEDEFTDYDLFAGCGYAMLGIDNYLPALQEEQQEEQQSYEFIPVYTY